MNDETNTAGTAMTVRKTTGLALSEGPSVLGERQVSLPIAGKIRPGIKVLTSTYAKNPKAAALYRAGVDAGRSFDEIDRDIKAAIGVDKSVLTPRNVDYFSVRRDDFRGMPELADRIMELYGEDRGEGRRLYRFPAVLPFDSWQAVMPHGLKAWTRSELMYWSEYAPDGTRYCKMRAAVALDPKTKRATKPFGGRPIVLRPENDGLCAPDACPQYQAGACKLSGALLVYIPGIPGTGAIEIPMTSFYALQGIRQQLELMLYLRGRIAGLYAGKPMFYIAKRQDEVSMIDPETAKPKKVRQWITTLIGTADMTAVLTAPEDDAVDAAAGRAIRILESSASEESEEPAPEEPAPEESEEPAEEHPPLEDTLRNIGMWLRSLRISYAIWEPYAAARYGEDWTKSPVIADQVLADLARVSAADRDEFCAMVRRGGDA